MTVFTGFLILVFLAVSCYGAKFYLFSDDIKTDYLGKTNNLALRAALSLMVIMNHLSQHSYVGVFEPVFHNTGYLGVAGFMFISGYGLMKNHSARSDYHKGFLKKRFISIVIPYFIIGIFYWFLYLFSGKALTVFQIVESFAHGDPFIPFSWYVVEIILFYFAFWLSMVIFKKRYKLIILFNLAVFGIVTYIGRNILFFSDYWFHASHMFTVGLVWALYEKQIVSFIKKHYYKTAIPAVLVFVAAAPLKHIFINEILDLDMYLPVSWFNSCLFIFLTLLLLMKVEFNSKILCFLGTISFELYLCQGAPIVFLRPVIENELLFCGVSIVLTIALAYCFNLLNRKVKKFGTVRK